MATSALDRLYQIDTPEALEECLNAFLTTVKGSYTLARVNIDNLIKSAINGKAEVSSDLYECYASSLRKSVDWVKVGDDLSAQWHANTDRFAAYKAYHITQELREAERRYADDPELKKAVQESIVRKYNRYQAAEEQTARHRARAGKQWERFHEKNRLRLFPNIQWLPSRSATPREEHIPFYHRIWPKDDPFWDYNQPGALWNCKCDWQEVKNNPTDSTPEGEEPKSVSPKGLQGNPAKTGRIFSENHPYYSKAGNSPNVVWAINSVGCTEMRNATLPELKIKTDIGDVQVGSWCYDEAAKSNIHDPHYYLKNEIVRNLNRYLPSLKHQDNPEKVDLSHNSPKSKAYKRKSHARAMHVFTGNVLGHDIVVKVLEMNDGQLKTYTVYIK